MKGDSIAQSVNICLNFEKENFDSGSCIEPKIYPICKRDVFHARVIRRDDDVFSVAAAISTITTAFNREYKPVVDIPLETPVVL